VQYPADRDVLKVTWSHKMTTQVLNRNVAEAPSHKGHVGAISDACLHLSHSGLFYQPQAEQLKTIILQLYFGT